MLLLHPREDRLERSDVVGAAIRRRVTADQRLERIADHEIVAVGRVLGGEAEDGVHERAIADRRPARDEDAAPGSGPRLDHAARLEQPHRFVDRRDRDAEALAQLVLGGDPLSGLALLRLDLRLELARDARRAGEPGQQGGGRRAPS